MKMADLRQSLTNSGFENVQSYIQSGNLIFESHETDCKVLAAGIYDVIQTNFGFDVPVLVTETPTIKTILKRNPFYDQERKNQYFALLHQPPNPAMMGNMVPEDYPNEEFLITKNCVYLNCKNGAGKAKLSNTILERKLGVTATTRNLNTMQRMVEMAR